MLGGKAAGIAAEKTGVSQPTVERAPSFAMRCKPAVRAGRDRLRHGLWLFSPHRIGLAYNVGDLVYVEPWGVRVVVDGKLVTGQNQMSASEYAIAFNHALAVKDPVLTM